MRKMIDWFILANGEENRVNEGLKLRGCRVEDLVSVTWNTERGCYIVIYKQR